MFSTLQKENTSLPAEVLSCIFSFLTIRDRKNVRLTCSEWYDACNVIPLLQDEKMIVRSTSGECDTMFDALINCSRLRFDIEFISVQFTGRSLIFWQKCGLRIESLKFFKCSFGQGSASQMIKSCTNLKSLYLDHCDESFYSNDSIDNYNTYKIRRESLRSLTLGTCFLVSDFILTRLFDIYPCIQEFSLKLMWINCHKRVDSRFYKPGTENYDSDSVFTFSSVFAKIALNAEILTKLELVKIGENGITDSWLEDIASLSRLRLKELTLDQHPLVSEKTFMKFFSVQTNLVNVSITKCQNFSLKCFLLMIQNCLNLEALRVESSSINPNFSMSKEIIQALIILPRLKILKLTGFFFMEESIDRMTFTNGELFQKLQKLTLKMPSKYSDIFIPRVSSNLIALHLRDKTGNVGLTDSDLQIIFEKLINLRCLSISLDSSVTDFGFTGSRKNKFDDSGIAISRLNRLEKLALEMKPSVDNMITETSFSHFIFPNLRKFSLHNFSNVSKESFELLCQQAPLVEYLNLQKSKIDYLILLRICERWKNLRTLILFYSGNISENILFDIQRLCPEFKMFQLNNGPLLYSSLFNYNKTELM